MALINPPSWMQAGSYPARTDRLAITSLLSYPGFGVDEATPMRIRQGVKPSYQNYQLKVRPAATPNMTVIVSAGFAFVDQHDTGGQGTYVCVNDADVTLPIAPAGSAGQYRKDAVVASVYDAEYVGSVSEWRLEVIQGPYAASAGAAVRGTLPPNAQLLADISIAPGQTSVSVANISDLRQYSVAAGGILPTNANAAPNRLHPGQALYLMDSDRFPYGRADGSQGALAKEPGAWTSWTPAWTTATGAATPSYGNATIDCKYTKTGRKVDFYMNITFGSTTNFGAGASGADNWKFSLPVPGTGTSVPIGKCSFDPGNTTRACSGMAQTTNNDAATMSLYVDGPQVNATAAAGGIADSITPFAWASGMRLAVVGCYESAS